MYLKINKKRASIKQEQMPLTRKIKSKRKDKDVH